MAKVRTITPPDDPAKALTCRCGYQAWFVTESHAECRNCGRTARIRFTRTDERRTVLWIGIMNLGM